MALRERLAEHARAWREARRRVWRGDERVWIELRGPPDPEARERIRGRVERSPGVRWARWNGPLQRLVVAHEGDPGAAVRAVREAEVAEGHAQRPFAPDPPRHPGDEGSARRAVVRVLADVASIGIGTVQRAASSKPEAVGIDLAALAQALENLPPARRWLDRRIGGSQSDQVLGLAATIASGIAHGTTGQWVDLVYRALRLAELRARAATWEARERELGHPDAHPPEALPDELRPGRLPSGPIERYSGPAGIASLGGFGFGVAVTGHAEKAAASILGTVPKPARVGREAFGAVLGRRLAERGVLVTDDRALRRLDRLDTVVLPRSLVEGRFAEVADVFPLGTLRRAELLLRAQRAVEAGEELRPPGELPALARRWAEAQERVVAIERNGRAVGLAAVRRSIGPGPRTLVARIREASLRLAVACDEPEAVAWASPDRVLPEGEALRVAIRALEAEGHGVLLVTDGPSPALDAADVSLAMGIPEGRPPWGAHLVGTGDRADALLVVDAVETAIRAARQSVAVAAAEAAAGFALSLEGQKPTVVGRIMRISGLASLVAVLNGARLARQIDAEAWQRRPSPWHALEPADVLRRLGSGPGGLTGAQADRRRGVPPPPPSRLEELAGAVWREMASPFAPILATGAGLSALMGSPVDAALVAGTVLASGVVGGWQEIAARDAMAELRRARPVPVCVLRDGAWTERTAADLVPGDVISLEAGARLPADCRILEAENVEADESAITGESVPVAKSAAPSLAGPIALRTSMLWAETSIAAGRARAVVVAVGDDTEARRAPPTAVPASRRAAGVHARLEEITRMTGPAAAMVGLGVVVGGTLRARPVRELVDTAVSLAVAAVPETLPLLATAAELAAARRLSARGALVRHVAAVEALGRVDTLCADKTGTLTEGVLRVQGVSDGGDPVPLDALGDGERAVLLAALLATPTGGPHPTDRALSDAAAGIGLAPGGWERGAELPFEPARGWHATLARRGRVRRLFVKGAPERVLERCTRVRTATEPRSARLDRDRWQALADALAGRGLRVLAIAERACARDRIDDADVRGLTLRGFVAIADPVRATASDAVCALLRAGIETVVITGDHPATARAIARQLGLGDDPAVITGPELDALPDEVLAERLRGVRVFARTTPQQKVRIVAALQRAGRVVAMTGDGANDAAAIRLADVGVALGERATAAARGAADVLVTDERIETLVDAVLEGRALWSSVRDAVSVLVGGNLGEMLFMLGGGLADGRSPLTPRQILLVNLLTDALPALVIAVRPPSRTAPEALLGEGPERSLAGPLVRDLAWRATATGGATLLAWSLARPLGSRERAGTVALLALVGTQLGQTLWLGGRDPRVATTALASGAVLLGIVEIPGLSRAAGCVPLGPVGLAQAASCAALGVVGAAILPSAWARAEQRYAISARVSQLWESELGRWLLESRVLQRLRGEVPEPGAAPSAAA